MSDPLLLVAWAPKGPSEAPHSILEGQLRLFGLDYVATAIEVSEFRIPDFFDMEGERRAQQGVNAAADATFYRWQCTAGDEGLYPTIQIRGRSYIIFFHPRAFDSSQKA